MKMLITLINAHLIEAIQLLIETFLGIINSIFLHFLYTLVNATLYSTQETTKVGYVKKVIGSGNILINCAFETR